MMKTIYRMILLILLLPVLNAGAAEGMGSIRLRLEVGDLPVIHGAFTAWRVGIPISDGYRIEEAYGGGFVREEDATSPHLAQWISAIEKDRGATILLDVDGNAVFSDLLPGLYLLEQTERTDGFYPIQPLLLTVPQEGNRDISIHLEPLPIVADAPPTGQDPTPYIGVVGLLISLAGLLFCTEWKRRW